MIWGYPYFWKHPGNGLPDVFPWPMDFHGIRHWGLGNTDPRNLQFWLLATAPAAYRLGPWRHTRGRREAPRNIGWRLPERRGGEIKLGVIWTLKLPISTPPEFNMYIKDVYRFFYTYIIAHKESEDDGLHPQNGHHQNCQIHARSRWWVFFTIFCTSEGRIQFLHLATIQHSSFASAKPSCELRGPAVDPTEKNTFWI